MVCVSLAKGRGRRKGRKERGRDGLQQQQWREDEGAGQEGEV